jgi:D-alanyl-D-alanine carboxypeptidase
MAALQTMVDTTAKELRTPQVESTVSYGTTLLGATSPPGAGTHIRIASNTKTMTAAVIGMQNGVKSKLLTFC